MKPELKRYSAVVGTRTFTFETGTLAAQAGGAVTFGVEDSIVFAAATMGGVREGIDFFPLSVDFEERMYAGGKIPGSFFRREGRASTDSILAVAPDRPPPAPALCSTGCATKCKSSCTHSQPMASTRWIFSRSTPLLPRS